MGVVRPAPAALLFSAVTVSDASLFEPVTSKLQERFGTVLFRLESFDFSALTSYYEEEMGPKLEKTFLIFQEPIVPERGFRYKVMTNELEQEHLLHGQRQVNIDPGILTLFNLCLLTTKGFSHRVYLGEGIFAEVTLKARNRRLEPMPWTYADYRTSEALAFLEAGRSYLKRLGRETNDILTEKKKNPRPGSYV